MPQLQYDFLGGGGREQSHFLAHIQSTRLTMQSRPSHEMLRGQTEPKQVKTLENQEQGTNCLHEAEKGALSCRVFCPSQGLAPV